MTALSYILIGASGALAIYTAIDGRFGFAAFYVTLLLFNVYTVSLLW